MEKKNANNSPKKDNINIKVKRNSRSNFFPIFIVILLIVIGIGGIIIYGRDGKPKLDDDDASNNDNVAGNTPNVDEDNKAGETDIYEEEQPLSEDAKRVYETLENATWASKNTNEKINIFKVVDGELECLVSTKKGKIDFDYGKIKYLRHVITGGKMTHITVLTEDGEAYIAETEEMVKYDYDLSRLEFTKIDVGEEIIDITFGNEKIGLVSYYKPYYLTKSGRLLSTDGEDYYKMNRDHINSIGVSESMVYVNRDGSLEILRNGIKDRYLDIIGKEGNKIIAKNIFVNIEDTLVTFYVVDSEDVLYTFSTDTMFVAEEYYKTSGKKVKKVEYNRDRNRVRIVTEDSRTISIEDISGYIDI